MAKETVGYQRLYRSLGCFPFGIPEFHQRYRLREGLNAEIHVAARRPHDDLRVPQGAYIYPLTPAPDGPYSVPEPFIEPPPPGIPPELQLVTQIIVWLNILVPNELSTSLASQQQDALLQLEKLVEEHKSELIQAVELLAGTLALRFHRQLITVLINEGLVLKVANDLNFKWESDYIEVLDPVWLTEHIGVSLTKGIDVVAPSKNPLWKEHSRLLRWLMRAWGEYDPVSKFVALFVPLEMMLAGQRVQRSENALRPGRAIRRLIDQYARTNREQHAELVGFYERLLQRYSEKPTLEERFAAYAEAAALPYWQADVEAFASYNRARNNIVHRGETNIHLTLTHEDAELLGLEELTEKYLAHYIYGDQWLYTSRTRRLRYAPFIEVHVGEERLIEQGSDTEVETPHIEVDTTGKDPEA